MSDSYCNKCERFHWFSGECNCHEMEYQFLYEGDKIDEDGWNTTWGYDAESTAQRIGENDYHADAVDPYKFEDFVAIREKGIVTVYKITAEATVDFSAEEIKWPEDK